MFFLSYFLAYLYVFVLAFFSPNRKSDGWAKWRLALLWYEKAPYKTKLSGAIADLFLFSGSVINMFLIRNGQTINRWLKWLRLYLNLQTNLTVTTSTSLTSKITFVLTRSFQRFKTKLAHDNEYNDILNSIFAAFHSPQHWTNKVKESMLHSMYTFWSVDSSQWCMDMEIL